MILGLFFSRGISLEVWLEKGLFDREVLIYKHYLENHIFKKIYWFTYGLKDEQLSCILKQEGRLPVNIEIIQYPLFFTIFNKRLSFLYSLFLPIIQCKFIELCDVFKTNQMDGSLAALISSGIYQKPVYVRTGYTLSRVMSEIKPWYSFRRMFASFNEALALKYADSFSVTSDYDKAYLLSKYKSINPEITVLGNYIDLKLFNGENKHFNVENNRMLFVGRFSEEKNIKNAIVACNNLNIGLDLIGSGSLEDNLRLLVSNLGSDTKFLGTFPNKELSYILTRYDYFILPSLWEGMPKVLIEAMASGLVCIGNNTTGIKELIKHQLTGFLSKDGSVQSLMTAIELALNSDKHRVSSNAKQFIEKNFSLDHIFSKEREIYNHLLEK